MMAQGKSSEVMSLASPSGTRDGFISLRKLLDEADEALDNETYPQSLAYQFDAPDDADYVISARTFRKLNRFIAAVDFQLKAEPHS